MSCFDHARLQRSRMISDSTFTGGPTGALFWSSRDDHLSEPALKEFWQMGFSPMKFKPESGADRIKSADDAYSFIHGAHAAFLSKQAALAGGAAGDQPSLHVRGERNSSVAILSGGGSGGGPA